MLVHPQPVEQRLVRADPPVVLREDAGTVGLRAFPIQPGETTLVTLEAYVLLADAPKHEMDIWVRKRQAHDNYNRLKKQAMDAQIPVLNANRFFILTGYTIR